MGNWSFPKIIIVLVALLFLLVGCAATPKIPPDEQQYVEGTMLEGGTSSFRLKVADGRVMTFSAYHDAQYEPDEFHALYGDRLGVTYGTVIAKNKEKKVAIKVALLKTDAGRLDIRSPAIGIIREAGMTRHKIHLPDNDITAIMVKGKSVSQVPNGWNPKAGDKVKVSFSKQPGWFIQKIIYTALELQAKEPVNIRDHQSRGVVTNITPGILTLRLLDGSIERFFRGTETGYIPAGRNFIKGDTVYVTYYRQLMRDHSFRLTAILVEKIK